MLSDGEVNNGNSQAGVEPAGEVITIVLTRKPWRVQLNAPATELVVCKAVLLCAIDEIDAQIRLGRVVALQQQQAENARVAAILAKGRGAMQQ